MTRDQKIISFIIVIVYTFIVLIGSCSHMFKQPYVDPVLKNAFNEWVNQCKLRNISWSFNGYTKIGSSKLYGAPLFPIKIKKI